MTQIPDKTMTDAEKWAFWVENLREVAEGFEMGLQEDPTDPDGLRPLLDDTRAQLARIDAGEDPAIVFANDKAALEAVLT